MSDIFAGELNISVDRLPAFLPPPLPFCPSVRHAYNLLFLSVEARSGSSNLREANLAQILNQLKTKQEIKQNILDASIFFKILL